MRDQRGDVREFGGLGLEEFLARGRVEEQVANSDGVPCGNPASSTARILPPAISTMVPLGWSVARVSRRKRETDAMDGRASPRKPNVATESRSSAFFSLLVA